jgi:hypothetical protein
MADRSHMSHPSPAGDDVFKALGLEDIKMPGGWSVSGGQTHLYTADERRLMHEARAFAQQELLPRARDAHRQVTRS